MNATQAAELEGKSNLLFGLETVARVNGIYGIFEGTLEKRSPSGEYLELNITSGPTAMQGNYWFRTADVGLAEDMNPPPATASTSAKTDTHASPAKKSSH